MKFAKKLLAVVLAGVLALAMLTACGGTADSGVTADKVIEAINTERKNAGQTELPRAEEVDKIWTPVAAKLAEYAAEPSNENNTGLTNAGNKAYAEYTAMQIDGKNIDKDASKRKSLRDVKDLGALQNNMKGGANGWEWLIKGDYDYISVVSADKNGHNGVIINAVKLKD